MRVIALFLVWLLAGWASATELNRNSTPAERERGCKWADRFQSQTLAEENGGSVTGTPTFAVGDTGGVSLNGTTDYLTYNLCGTEFNSDPISIVIEFTPDFDYDDNAWSYLIHTTATQWTILKRDNAGSNLLSFQLDGTWLPDIAAATYSGFWLANQRNVFVISGTSGDTSIWLNGNIILNSSGTAWTPGSVTSLFVGATTGGAQRFDGTIHSLQVYHAKLTAIDALAIYDQTWEQPSLITDLITEGALVLYHDYRAGHMLDLSGQGNHGTPTLVDWQGGGVRFNASTSKITVADAAELQLTAGALVVFGDFMVQGTETLIYKRDAGGTNYDLNLTAANVQLYDGTNTRTLATGITGHKCIAVNMSNGSTGEVFVDGVSAGSLDDTSAISVDDAALLIGNDHDDGNNTGSTVDSVVIVNRPLTPTEMAQVYAELSNMRWPRKTSGRAQGVYGPELVTDGDMEAVGVAAWTAGAAATLTKQTGNVLGGSQVLRVAHAGTANPYAAQTVVTVGTRYRISGWARGDGTGAPRVDIGATTIWTGTVAATWQRFDLSYLAAATDVRLVNVIGVAGYGEFDNVSVKEVLTDEIQFKTDWGTPAAGENITAGFIPDTPFEVSSGTWKVSTDTINGETVKVIECVADGTLGLDTSYVEGSPTLDAYGTWEIWINKAETSTAYFAPVSDAAGAVYNTLYLTATEAIWFLRNGPVSLMTTANGTITAGAWHQYRITRSNAGSWTVYLDGTAVTAATGTNPVTDNTIKTAEAMGFTLAAGDKIALSDLAGDHSLVKWHGVVSP